MTPDDVGCIAGIHELARVDKQGTLALSEALLTRGVHTIPRGMCASAAHGEAEIEATIAALTGAIGECRGR